VHRFRASTRPLALPAQVIDRILFKLDELVRPFVHKILVVIEPLLIDEDYYARVEGREIIANLAKARESETPLRVLPALAVCPSFVLLAVCSCRCLTASVPGPIEQEALVWGAWAGRGVGNYAAQGSLTPHDRGQPPDWNAGSLPRLAAHRRSLNPVYGCQAEGPQVSFSARQSGRAAEMRILSLAAK
jgi:hypothetical protein